MKEKLFFDVLVDKTFSREKEMLHAYPMFGTAVLFLGIIVSFDYMLAFIVQHVFYYRLFQSGIVGPFSYFHMFAIL